MKKIFIYFVVIFLISVIGLFSYGLLRSPVGPPDSFIQTNKECVIQKNDTDKELNNVFTITCGTQPYLIANSEFDLTSYIGKKVIIRAAYPKNKSNTDSVQTDRQCIAEKCQLIYKDGRSVYAVNILSIEETK